MVKNSHNLPLTFPQAVFFIGIGGIGVSAIAKLALYQKIQVYGTDLAQTPLTDELSGNGAEISIAKDTGKYEKNNLQKNNIGLVVYTTATPPNHPLLVQSKKFGIPTRSYPQILGEISRTKYTIAVSGMHGKSTTTSMIGIMLEHAGLDPLVIVGTQVQEWGGNIRIKSKVRKGGLTHLDEMRGKSEPCSELYWIGTANKRRAFNKAYRQMRKSSKDIFVVEADEYRSAMLNLEPDIIVLTRVEEDHLDYYKDIGHIKREFRKYVKKVPAAGAVIANWTDKNIRSIVKLLHCQIVRYNTDDDTSIKNKIKNVLKVHGEHNIENALAAYKVGERLGLHEKVILKGLARFKGTWRRMEHVGNFQFSIFNFQIPVISDYAHHPTEIKATLKALREQYPNKRLVLAYQPHQHNRTKMLFNGFVSAFDDADVLIMNEIYDVAGRKERADETVSSKALVSAIKKRIDEHCYIATLLHCYYTATLDETRRKILKVIKPNDILVIMGAGDIDSVARDLAKKILMSITLKKNIRLAPYTTLKIGGPADYFIEAQNEEEVIDTLVWAEERKIPYYILSGGSNVLVSDQGFRGLVIRITNYELRITPPSPPLTKGGIGGVVTAGAGVMLPLLAKKTAEQGLSGFEFGIGVPGTVGGAVYGNAGAFGQETKDVLESVRVVMPNHKNENQWVITELPNKACQFAYRESIFKKRKNWIILAATFHLKTDTPENCKKRMREMLTDKTTNQPMGELAAGSIFKNPPQQKAWELISEAEMKGYQIGGAKVSDIHANYIINTGNATSEQMIMLIAMIKQRVRVRAKVQLQEEIQYVGF